MDNQKLAQLLDKACPRPSYLASSDGGPLLALALHCLMVNEGFVLVVEGDHFVSDPETRFAPQKDWNGKLLDQWMFTYTKSGKARKFTLHCSLQARTKRMFIHASEENNLSNVRVLGLQLENYVPHPDALASGSWGPAAIEKAVVRNAEKMMELMAEHILTPLLQAAEDEQGPPPGAVPTAGQGEQRRHQDGLMQGQVGYLTAAAVMGLAVGVVSLIFLHTRAPLLQRRA